MLKLKRIMISKIAMSALIILSAVNCAKDQNSFLPYTRIDLHISLVNYNHLKVSGNSILFKNEGYKGLFVVCVNPDLNLYNAFDACCPYEEDYSGTIEVKPIAKLTSPPGTVYSSDFFGVCNKCGSVFNLIGNGDPHKGPATHYLQRYSISSGFENLTITN